MMLMRQTRKNRSSIPEPSSIEWGCLRDAVGHLARRTHLISQAAYAEAFEAFGLNSFQYGILELASLNQFLTQRRLAELILVDPSIVVGAIDRLEERGLIRRSRSREDRRAFFLETTDAGAEVLKELRDAGARAEDRITARLSASERRALLGAMRKIAGL